MSDLPKYIIVENYIKKEIKNKTLVDKLPGERSLAKELAPKMLKFAKDSANGIAGISKPADSNTVTFESLPLGYYLVDSILYVAILLLFLTNKTTSVLSARIILVTSLISPSMFKPLSITLAGLKFP